MKRVFAFIILLCHLNTSMFLPQIAEDDVFDANGKQVDDVNSVIENVEYNFQQIVYSIEPIITSSIVPPVFYHRDEERFQTIALEIITPPPDLS
jgi:outer membrane lipoprotein-sorting protein